MIISKNYQTLKPKMAMAALATTLLLASPSSARSSAADIVNENVGSRTAKLRGGTRSLSALAPKPIFLEDNTVTLPVTPGIAEGVDSADLPCLVETICDQPELSVLCGFITFNIDTWNETSGMDNFFLGEGQGTFLAPMDEAFEDSGTLLQHILEIDLRNPAILENVLSYHVIDIDQTQNATDLLVSLEDFVCDAYLMMANGEMSHTLCFDEFQKHQIGFGNRNIRNLPKIIEMGIESCDGDVVMHFVDQLVLPPLPLKEMPTTLPSLEAGTCPVDRPELNGSCQNLGQACEYGYSYSGCSWGELQCVPRMSCLCSDREGTGTGSWSCTIDLEQTLTECPEPISTETIARTTEKESVAEKPPPVNSRGLPTGACDPNEPLPSPPDECPVSRSQSCLGYKVGKSCEYGHVYHGCTWKELSCQTVESCICTADGRWMCAASSVQRCGSFDPDLGWVDDVLPEGLPWGESCDPDAELPVPPSDEVESVTSRLSLECPSSFSFGSCERFEPGLQCDYNYAYDGCTWETLECSPVMQCQCNLFQNGDWACRSESRLSCSNRRPEGLPVGRCDPNVPLPLPPTTDSTTVTAEASSTAVNNDESVGLSLTSNESEFDGEEEVVLSLMTGGMP